MIPRVLSVLAGLFFVVSPLASRAEEKPAGDPPKAAIAKKADIRAIIEAGRADHSIPPRVVVRVGAHLTRVSSETSKHGAGVEKTFKERWEFSFNRVHRIVEAASETGGDTTLQRAESIPCDTDGICKDLLDGGIFTIGEAGKGERQNFIDTYYDIGHRAIEIVVGGKSVLFVGESCVVAGYVESDARAFASLYEKLAKKARDAFEAKRTRDGQTK